jgi:hypothetical protein
MNKARLKTLYKVPIGIIINKTSEALSDNNDDNGDKVNKNDIESCETDF